MIALDILSDGFFAAIAGIGFGAISDPPLRAFKMIAIYSSCFRPGAHHGLQEQESHLPE